MNHSLRRSFLLCLVALSTVLSGCCRCTSGPDCPSLTAAGPPPQVPVNFREGLWVTITTHGVHEGPIAYMLALGTEVMALELSTSKGTVTLNPGSEQWFSVSEEALRGSLDGATSVKWSVEKVEKLESEEDAAALASLIGAAVGLQNQGAGVPLEPSVTGPSGAVEWTPMTSLPADVSSFRFPSLSANAPKWYLSAAMSGGAISKVLWSTSKKAGSYTLPQRFGEAGAFELSSDNAATIEAAFTGYVYP
ncbi:MAG: hypothetical protein KC731_41370 [Myxococcales bacterium]|nr:hypothetical protein [Myxococcales bacterium]